MSKRKKVGRRRSWSLRRSALELFTPNGQRRRRTLNFEQLEDRFAFSVVPPGAEITSLSNDTPEGALAIWQNELQWATREAANAATTTQQVESQHAYFSLPDDPMFAYQWHLLNTGQEVGNPDLQHLFGVAGTDINVVPVWNMGYTGTDVKVAVIDSGVQLFHEDLSANIDPTLRLNAFNGSTNVAPDMFSAAPYHGTAVAGIIGAVANNGIGGAGIAPGATIVPIKLSDLFTDQEIETAFQFTVQNNLDVTNNSWGTPGRVAIPATPTLLSILRESAVFGRSGLGEIHVFASGNDAGPFFTNQVPGFGNYNSSSYSPYVNTRYTIGVTGVDHDGLYINDDGTFTSWPVAGPSVLVAAPTGSAHPSLNIADDDGYGSGIWTTDLVGDFGLNSEPLPSGFDPDADFWPDPDYTSRMGGTSAAAPMVTGVVALMLDANPNLTYRDVQEILVRSAKQVAQFESPASGGLSGALASQTTWQVNQIEPFRNPDPFFSPAFIGSVTALVDPVTDTNVDGFTFPDIFYAADSNDGARQDSSHYEPQPALFTNGAGYTVSQGYGVYAEQIGYAHGLVDAELAVQMALQWNTLGQDIAPDTERTYTTSIVNPGPNNGWNLPAMEKGSGPPNGINFLVPGGIAGLGGYIDYWNEYFQDDPFSDYDGPAPEQRGLSYIDFAVPPSQGIDVEWVEVKLELDGPADDLDFLRIFLTSPDGTQSELNHYYGDPGIGTPFTVQTSASPAGFIDPAGDINPLGGDFVWTFSTNRHWGESTNSAPIIHPITGEPLVQHVTAIDPDTGFLVESDQPVFRNWELHIENWSTSDYSLPIVEVVWHGKPIAGGQFDPNYSEYGVASAQRVQGFVGIDTNSDEEFNFSRYIQTLAGSHTDVETIRESEVFRQLDFNDNNLNGIYDEGDTINQEPFAENIVVQAYRVFDGVAETNPVSQFLTGHDGNYYFDLNVQGDLAYANSIGATLEYEIRAVDPLDRPLLEDTATPSLPASDPQFTYLPHYKEVWRINPDWFFAPDRDNTLLLDDEPAEILFDPITNAPHPFTSNDSFAPVPMAVKNLNFLLKQDAPVQQFDVHGTVYADLDGDGKFNGDDTSVGGVFVYQDVNRNGVHDPGEQMVITSDDPLTRGQYTLTIPADHIDTYQVGVIAPTADWLFTDPGQDGVQSVFAGPGSPTQTADFFLDPPNDAYPPSGSDSPGNIAGVVFSDLNANGSRDPGDVGLPGFRVFIDANENGAYDNGEEYGITSSNGSFFLSDIPPGLVRIDVEIANEGTEDASWELTTPALGYRQVDLGPGGVVSGQNFGLDNRADKDWGDLPDSYQTLASSNGPSHVIIPGFQLGSGIDGEVNGIPTDTANGDDLVGNDDDGIVILSNGGNLQVGPNVLQITVQGVGGLLNGWMDFNGDGHFDAGEQVFKNLDINQGTVQRTVNVPEGSVTGAIAARFRWGDPNLSWFGPAGIGEVEDYLFPSSVVAVLPLAGDYNGDLTVDELDRSLWASTFGSTTDLRADGNDNGIVDSADYLVWRKNRGASAASSSTAATASISDVTSDATDPPASSQQQFQVVVLSGGLAGVVDTSIDDSVSPTLVESTSAAAVNTDVPVGLSASIDVVATPAAARPAYRPVSGTVSSESSSFDSNLVLVDHALADFNTGSDDSDDGSLVGYLRDADNIDDVSDLALAAVIEDDSSWWSGI